MVVMMLNKTDATIFCIVCWRFFDFTTLKLMCFVLNGSVYFALCLVCCLWCFDYHVIDCCFGSILLRSCTVSLLFAISLYCLLLLPGFVALEPMFFWKQPLYLHEVVVMSASFYPPQTLLWDFTGYIVVVLRSAVKAVQIYITLSA